MQLSDLKPKKSSFLLKIKGRRDKRLFLRPFSLSDESWVQQNFDVNDLSLKLLQGDIDVACQLIWHLLEMESKKYVLSIPVDFKDVDDDGNEISVELKGYEKFMGVLGETGMQTPLEAFYRSRGLNDSVVKKTHKSTQDTLKKKTLIGE